MSKVRILIVEDELLIAQEMKYTLTSAGYAVLDIVDNTMDARRALEIYQLDIILLDVMLRGEEDGLTLAKEISNNQQIPIIFITSLVDEDTIKRAMESRPSAYLLKPYNQRELQIAIDMAFHNYEQKKVSDLSQQEAKPSSHYTFNQHVFIRDNHRFERLEFQDILWMKAENTYVSIETAMKNYLLTSDTLGSMLEKLCCPWMLRVHRSYAVNTQKVKAIDGNQLTVGSQLIPIGKNYRQTVKQFFPVL